MNGCKPCIGEPARLQSAPTDVCRVSPKERQMQREPVRNLANPNYGLCPKVRQMQREPRRRGLQPRLGDRRACALAKRAYRHVPRLS